MANAMRVQLPTQTEPLIDFNIEGKPSDHASITVTWVTILAAIGAATVLRRLRR